MTNDDHYPAPEVALPMTTTGAEIVNLDGQVVLSLKNGPSDVAYLSEWFLEAWLLRLREAKGNAKLAAELRRTNVENARMVFGGSATELRRIGR